MNVGSVVAKADQAECEADHGIAVERADDVSTGLCGDDEGDVRLGLEIGFAPDFSLDVDAAVEVFEAKSHLRMERSGVMGESSVLSYQF